MLASNNFVLVVSAARFIVLLTIGSRRHNSLLRVWTVATSVRLQLQLRSFCQTALILQQRGYAHLVPQPI